MTKSSQQTGSGLNLSNWLVQVGFKNCAFMDEKLNKKAKKENMVSILLLLDTSQLKYANRPTILVLQVEL